MNQITKQEVTDCINVGLTWSMTLCGMETETAALGEADEMLQCDKPVLTMIAKVTFRVNYIVIRNYIEQVQRVVQQRKGQPSDAIAAFGYAVNCHRDEEQVGKADPFPTYEMQYDGLRWEHDDLLDDIVTALRLPMDLADRVAGRMEGDWRMMFDEVVRWRRESNAVVDVVDDEPPLTKLPGDDEMKQRLKDALMECMSPEGIAYAAAYLQVSLGHHTANDEAKKAASETEWLHNTMIETVGVDSCNECWERLGL